MTDLVFIEHKPTNFFARVIRNDYSMITDLWRRQITMSKGRRFERYCQDKNINVTNRRFVAHKSKFVMLSIPFMLKDGNAKRFGKSVQE